MADPGDRGIVLANPGGDDLSTNLAGHVHHIHPESKPVAAGVGVDRMVERDHPHGAAEQVGAGCGPAGVRGAGHGVATHIPVRHAVFLNQLVHLAFHTHNIGETAGGSMLGNDVEQAGNSGHGGC